MKNFIRLLNLSGRELNEEISRKQNWNSKDCKAYEKADRIESEKLVYNSIAGAEKICLMNDSSDCEIAYFEIMNRSERFVFDLKISDAFKVCFADDAPEPCGKSLRVKDCCHFGKSWCSLRQMPEQARYLANILDTRNTVYRPRACQ